VFGLKEIASHLGISVSTVSRVVNNKDRVDPKTRDMVLSALREFPYTPNDSARILRGKRSHIIGIIVSDISNIFFAKIVRGAENAARFYGYSILICNTDSDPGREEEQVLNLLSKHISGIIMAGASLETDIRKLIGQSAVPYVYVDNLPFRDDNCRSVSIENARAAHKLLDYLVERGHERIAILAGSQRESSGKERLLGWRQGMQKHHLPVDEDLVIGGEFTQESGFSGTERLLARKKHPTAIFAANNKLAYGAMQSLKHNGFSVPEDISIVAFDADDETRLITPRITSMNQPVFEFGQVAIDLCLQGKNCSRDGQQNHVILEPVLAEGDSVMVI
jgi:LacI family transcriptional regulator